MSNENYSVIFSWICLAGAAARSVFLGPAQHPTVCYSDNAAATPSALAVPADGLSACEKEKWGLLCGV